MQAVKKVAESTRNLLKKIKKRKILTPKISFAHTVIIITWLFISYQLYPHAAPLGEVKGIADNNVLKKTAKVINPTPTLYVYKNTSSSTNKHSYVLVNSLKNTNASSSAHTTAPSTNGSSSIASSNNASSTQSSSPTNTPINENEPTPTLFPSPTAPISVTQNPVVSLNPAVSPTTNEDNTTLGNTLSILVRTIVSSAPSQ